MNVQVDRKEEIGKRESTLSQNACSYLYSGTLMHQRLLPKEHKFNYSLPVFSINLNEIESLAKKTKLFSYNSSSVFSIRDKDYINKENISIKDKALNLIESAIHKDLVSSVWLVTSPRYFNYVFNPVSFYYYLDSSNQPLCWLAEVNNTFSEKHLYFIKKDSSIETKKGHEAELSKEFHVSPFNNMEGKYKFFFGHLNAGSNEKLDVRVDLYKKDSNENFQLNFRSSLTGKGAEFSSDSLKRFIYKYPLSASLNSFRIHKQAASLYFKKKLPIFTKPVPLSNSTTQPSMPLRSSLYVTLFNKLLGGIRVGRLNLRYPNGELKSFGDKKSELQAELIIRDWSFFSKVVRGGDVAFGEAYVDGLVDSGSLTKLIQIAALNTELLKGETALSGPKKFLDSLIHKFRKNTIDKSRKNISEHYDLNNHFFSLFLDKSMTYSSAVYLDGNKDLHQAQLDKIRLIAKKADIKENHHVLEIGCGWGSFSIDTVKRTGCRLTGLTLSTEQKKLADERIRAEGLEDRISIKLLDYRKVEGTFDRIVSIEMLEAVGHDFLEEYFRVIDKCLVSGGKAVIQSITIPDERYEDYTKGCDWIQKYIFPGGHLPSEAVLGSIMSRISSLSISDTQRIGLDYADTLKDWRKVFHEKKPEILKLGFDEKFFRTWDYYFCYCEGGFRAKVINNIQMIIKKS